MPSRSTNGFTVIEVMLFLGVTGILAVGILVGSGVAIGQQRYRDSVNSLKSLIQEQYHQATNVTNGRNGEWSCDSFTTVAEGPIGGGEARGTSECVLLGRLVRIDAAGTGVTASSVVGYRTPGAPVASSDILELQTNYRIGISPIDQEETAMSWGAQVVQPGGVTPAPLSVLIIRSPLSGSVMTFTATGAAPNLNTLVMADNLAQTRDLCVNADAGSFVGKRMEVRISSYASNQGAVQIPSESESVCD